MWSEGDQQYSQWALNPSAYQDVSHEQVDWAALAQQWIQMKDTCPADQMPPAPPPPPLGRPDEKHKSSEIEGGEAPMEMDREEHPNSNSSHDAPPAWNGPGPWTNNWQQQWGGWGWGSGGGGPPGGVPPPNPAAVLSKQPAVMPVPGYGYSTSTPGFVPPATGFAYNAGPSASSGEFNQVMVGGYWTAGPHGNNAAAGPGSMAPFIRSNRQDWSKRNDRSHERSNSMDKSDDEDDSMLALDAAKRRQLPAWIREGLEKMEREKQRKIDRDVQIREREIYLQKKKEEEDLLMTEMENNGEPRVPKKSKFESDSEESDSGEVGGPAVLIGGSKKKSRFRNANSPSSSPHRVVVKVPPPEPQLIKSREDITQETMLKVRRMLTEILLEVTTEEMEAVAQEVLAKAKAKGLGIYGDSEDESGSDDDAASPQSAADDADSDEELQEQIQRRKNEFSKTEREIEARLREEEEKEKEQERRLIADRGEDSDVEERQVVNNQSDKRPVAADGTRIKLEPVDQTRQHFDYQTLEENSVLSSKDLHHSKVKKEIKCELITGIRSDKRSAHHAASVKVEEVIVKQEKFSSDDQEEATSKSDSDSSSSSKSSSSAVKTSSSESKRSSKKRSKNGHSRERTKKSSRKKRNGSEEKRTKKSDDKSSSKSKSKGLESREGKVKEKKREKRDRSASKEKRSRHSPSRERTKESKRSKRSRSRDVRASKRSPSRDRKAARRSRSKESRRSRRSHSRESHRSKSDRRASDGHSRRKQESHKSRDSRSKERTSHKSSGSRKGRKSRSPSKEKKSSASSKRPRRESTGSRSSRSPSARRDKRSSRGGRYSRSRSASAVASRHKKARRRDSSSSSGRSSRATVR